MSLPPPARTRRELTVDEFEAGVRAGQLAILARAITLVESQQERHQRQAEELLTRLLPATGKAIRVGITGAPGAGKSTFIEALGLQLVDQSHRVAVLAVDPSSGISGGSILGDKTRMTHLAGRPQAFIRPSPSAGTLGGVARKTRESMLLCEAAGYDVVLIETVGVGQSETMVADMTDCFLAIMIPGAGDELQGIKRGLLELVDLIAVNKADGATRTAAELAARQYRNALATLASRHPDDLPQVFTCSALQQEGIAPIWQAIRNRQTRLEEEGLLTERRRRQALRWVWSTVESRLREALHADPAVQAITAELETAVLNGTRSAESAARAILAAFGLPRDPR